MGIFGMFMFDLFIVSDGFVVGMFKFERLGLGFFMLLLSLFILYLMFVFFVEILIFGILVLNWVLGVLLLNFVLLIEGFNVGKFVLGRLKLRFIVFLGFRMFRLEKF